MTTSVLLVNSKRMRSSVPILVRHTGVVVNISVTISAMGAVNNSFRHLLWC